MKLSNFLFLVVFLALYGCLEPFTPHLNESGDSFLVVDGIITDQPGPYTVKITKSAGIDEETEFVSGVDMSIEEENGVVESLTEVSDGVYQTIGMQGVEGRRYRLNFNYLGQQYQSAWQKIYASPVIDSIYYKAEKRGTTGKDNDVYGVQFFIANHGAEDGTKYFRFEWDETWRIGVARGITDDYVGRDSITPTTKVFNTTCWKSAETRSLNLGTTLGLSKNLLSGHKLGFITGEEARFTRKYSTLVKQYTLSEEEYLFWKYLKEANEEIGGLFGKQPAKVVSNVTNISNPGETILGYFSASGLSEKRIYVGTANLPFELIANPSCPVQTYLKEDLMEDYELTLLQSIENGNLFFRLLFLEDDPEIVSGAEVTSLRCVDCVANGGTNIKPDFWEE
ncbi:DUF4249 domain-containing protein [Reichenbachiella sp. MALMAid0571]|uniref:DUF4249 domain-containing protein n=1 Tax=Reichenbachiella sp. MALMAid0571 TaxID=3143939 RepID=UPI0032DF8E98